MYDSFIYEVQIEEITNEALFEAEMLMEAEAEAEAEVEAGDQQKKIRKIDDGWFRYYVDIETGEKYFTMPEGAELIEWQPDDFYRG